MTKFTKLEDAKKELMEKLTGLGLGTAIQVFNNIIIETPVDTGRARGNWQATLTTPASGEISKEAANANNTDITKDIQSWKITDIAYLTNNLPYIEPLELGWSGQRPDGWVRANVSKGQTALNEAVNKLGDK